MPTAVCRDLVFPSRLGIRTSTVPRPARHFAFRGHRNDRKRLRAAIAGLIRPYPKRPTANLSQTCERFDQPAPAAATVSSQSWKSPTNGSSCAQRGRGSRASKRTLPRFLPEVGGFGVFGTLDFGIGAESVHEIRLFAASSGQPPDGVAVFDTGPSGMRSAVPVRRPMASRKVVTLPLVDAVPLLRPMASWNVRGSDGLDRPSACAVAASSSTASTSLFSSNA